MARNAVEAMIVIQYVNTRHTRSNEHERESMNQTVGITGIAMIILFANNVTAGPPPVEPHGVIDQVEAVKILTHEGETDANGCHRDPYGTWHCH